MTMYKPKYSRGGPLAKDDESVLDLEPSSAFEEPLTSGPRCSVCGAHSTAFSFPADLENGGYRECLNAQGERTKAFDYRLAVRTPAKHPTCDAIRRLADQVGGLEIKHSNLEARHGDLWNDVQKLFRLWDAGPGRKRWRARVLRGRAASFVRSIARVIEGEP
jgi:hypothetical protein